MSLSKTVRCTGCGFKVLKSTCDDDRFCVACQLDKPTDQRTQGKTLDELLEEIRNDKRLDELLEEIRNDKRLDELLEEIRTKQPATDKTGL